ncbi:MAG: hypothetical protein H7321_05995 [Bacteroidia bacterium]|nr:hypothetical protein [Bacteroidia bacterium]
MLNCTGSIFAQAQKPEWNFSLSTSAFKAGDTIEIIFSAKIPFNNHMYSTNTVCEIGPIKPEIQINAVNATVLGTIYSVNDKSEKDEIFECVVGTWSHKAEIRQKIVINNNSKVTFTGSLTTQYCDDKKGMCFMDTFDFSY